MGKHRVGNWEIITHENGVVEFITKKRALMVTPDMSDADAEATMEALPKYVLERWIRLLDIQLSKEEMNGGEM